MHRQMIFEEASCFRRHDAPPPLFIQTAIQARQLGSISAQRVPCDTALGQLGKGFHCSKSCLYTAIDTTRGDRIIQFIGVLPEMGFGRGLCGDCCKSPKGAGLALSLISHSPPRSTLGALVTATKRDQVAHGADYGAAPADKKVARSAISARACVRRPRGNRHRHHSARSISASSSSCQIDNIFATSMSSWRRCGTLSRRLNRPSDIRRDVFFDRQNPAPLRTVHSAENVAAHGEPDAQRAR